MSLNGIVRVEIKIRASSRSRTALCEIDGSRSDSSSLWLLVSLNVSAVQPELFRAVACINTVTRMGGLWEMERLQLTIATPVLSIWRGEMVLRCVRKAWWMKAQRRSHGDENFG